MQKPNFLEKYFDLIVFCSVSLICFGLFYASIWEQMIKGAFPCSSCMVSRTAQFIIAAVGFLTLRYGLKYRYIGTILIVAVVDIYIGIRHSTFHHNFYNDPILEPPLFGYLLPDWVILIELIIVLAMGITMYTYKNLSLNGYEKPREFKFREKALAVVFFALLVINSVQSFALSGPPPFTRPSTANGYLQ